MRDRSRQSADRGKLLLREQLLTSTFELFEIARKFCLARAQIIYKQPDQQSHHGINHCHRACFDVFAEFQRERKLLESNC